MRGILFKPWKIKAIADSPPDTVWQTRRVIKPQPKITVDDNGKLSCIWQFKPSETMIMTSYNHLYLITDDMTKHARYQVGELVYIKEACWYPPEHNQNHNLVAYRLIVAENCGEEAASKSIWKNPRTMPAWAARYFIKILSVKAERVQEITLTDIYDEGIDVVPAYNRIDAYRRLWDSINAKSSYSWQSNPWVFAYTFRLEGGK